MKSTQGIVPKFFPKYSRWSFALMCKMPSKPVNLYFFFILDSNNLKGKPTFGRIVPNRLILKPRGKSEPHNMILNHIEKRFHAKFYVNQRFSKRNVIRYI